MSYRNGGIFVLCFLDQVGSKYRRKITQEISSLQIPLGMKHEVTCDTSQPGYTRLGSGQASSLTRHLFDRNKVFCVWHTDLGVTIQTQLDTTQLKGHSNETTLLFGHLFYWGIIFF